MLIYRQNPLQDAEEQTARPERPAPELQMDFLVSWEEGGRQVCMQCPLHSTGSDGVFMALKGPWDSRQG
jgi:hypothetical protein